MKTSTSFKKGHPSTYTKTGKQHSRYKHGKYGTPLYKRWESMKRRCLNKNERSYPDYGGRGIKICDKWLDFQGFAADMEVTFKPELSIERIDYNGNYEPGNCKWIPLSDQSKNRRGIKFYEYNGLKLSCADWARKLGIDQFTLYARLTKYNWSIEEALTVPANYGNKYRNHRTSSNP